MTSSPEAGDGRELREYLLRHALSRSLFFIELSEGSTGRHVYAVDVNYFADELSEADGSEPDDDDDDDPESTESPAALYRDGVQVLRSDLPTAFPVPGGVIEVRASMYGLRRMRYVGDGYESALTPHPYSAEGLRAALGRRFPRVSRVIGFVAVVILLIGLVLSVPQALEALSRIDLVADYVGVFVSPVHLPAWANTALAVASVLAALERALTLKSHRVIDMTSEWGDGE